MNYKSIIIFPFITGMVTAFCGIVVPDPKAIAAILILNTAHYFCK